MQKNNYSLTDLSIDEINLLLNGLGELPSKMSYFLINKIHKCIKEQTIEENITPNTRGE